MKGAEAPLHIFLDAKAGISPSRSYVATGHFEQVTYDPLCGLRKPVGKALDIAIIHDLFVAGVAVGFPNWRKVPANDAVRT